MSLSETAPSTTTFFDVYGNTDQLDEPILEVMATRLEARYARPEFQRMMVEYLELMRIDQADTVLDVGCGTGVAARYIAGRPNFTGRVTAVDISDHLLENGRRLAQEQGIDSYIDFRQGDSRRLNLPDNSFDAVVAHTLISHVDDLEASRAWHDPDVAGALDALLADPQPLVRALARYPTTLVHGSYRGPNLGLKREPCPRAYVLDWQLASRTVATVDAAWFLTFLRRDLDIEQGMLYYQQCLTRRLGERFDPTQWQPMWDLGMLVNILRMCPFRAWSAVHHKHETDRAAEQLKLSTHNELVHTALQWL